MNQIDSIVDRYVIKLTEQRMSIAQIEKELDSQPVDKEQKKIILYLTQKKAFEKHNLEQDKKLKQKKVKILLLLLLIAIPGGYLISQITIPEKYIIYANASVIHWVVMIIGTILTALFTALAKR